MIPVGFLIDPSGVAPNPCDPNPEMVITVSTTNPGEANVNWVGETWSHSPTAGQYNFGTPVSVCPTFYTKSQSSSAAFTQTFMAVHRWYKNGLSMQRAYRIVEHYSFSNSWARVGPGNGNNLSLIVGPNYPTDFIRDYAYWSFYGFQPGIPPPPMGIAGYKFIFNSGLNKVLTVADPTWSNYNLTNEFFGFYTAGTLTYTWSQGVGW